MRGRLNLSSLKVTDLLALVTICPLHNQLHDRDWPSECPEDDNDEVQR